MTKENYHIETYARRQDNVLCSFIDLFKWTRIERTGDNVSLFDRVMEIHIMTSSKINENPNDTKIGR